MLCNNLITVSFVGFLCVFLSCLVCFYFCIVLIQSTVQDFRGNLLYLKKFFFFEMHMKFSSGNFAKVCKNVI